MRNLFLAASLAFAAPAAAAPTEPWWRSLGDPQLAALIDAELADHHDVQAAFARVRQAEAVSWGQASALTPTLTFDLNGSASPYSSLGFQFGGLRPPTEDDPFAFYNGSAMFNASWNVDVFGRTVANTRASQHDAAAAAGDLDAMTASVALRLAGAWFDLQAAVAQRALAERQLDEAQRLLDALQVRYGGDATALDLLQQRQQVASLRAALPRAQASEGAARAQMVALLGGDAPPEAAGALALPVVPSLPDPLSDALRDRPDVRAAEARLDAASAREHAALATALPSLNVRANAGWQAVKITETRDQSVWGASAGVSVPILAGGRNAQQIRAARFAEQAAEHQVEQALLNAEAAVRGAHAQLLGLEGQREAVLAQREAAQLAHEVALEQYLRGTTSFLVVQSTQNALIAAELSHLALHRQALGAAAQLHDALGGAWTEDLAGLRVK